jgi:hypothetical protein
MRKIVLYHIVIMSVESIKLISKKLKNNQNEKGTNGPHHPNNKFISPRRTCFLFMTYISKFITNITSDDNQSVQWFSH